MVGPARRALHGSRLLSFAAAGAARGAGIMILLWLLR